MEKIKMSSNPISPKEYEKIVSRLVSDFQKNIPELEQATIGYDKQGKLNRILGGSGYKHQIDISIQLKSSIFIIECKCYRSKVMVGDILVLASRAKDISDSQHFIEVVPSIVTTVGVSRNVPKIAEHFNIGIDIVRNSEEYAMRIRNKIFCGLKERPKFGAYADAEVIKGKGNA